MEVTIRIQVIKVYEVTVEARSQKAALKAVEGMQTEEIYKQGILKDVSTDYAEVA